MLICNFLPNFGISSLDVNHILFEATRMYGELVHSVAIHSSYYVSHDRLLSVVNLLENSFTISYVLASFHGNTGVRTSYLINSVKFL